MLTLCCSASLEQSLEEKSQECSSLQQQLAASNAARESAESSLKNEQATSQKLLHKHNELKTTCEEFKGEVNSLLADLQEQTSTIKTLEEERDALRSQVQTAICGSNRSWQCPQRGCQRSRRFLIRSNQ